MTFYLLTTFFYLLLFLLIFFTLCLQVCANSNKLLSTSDKTVELFKNVENNNIKTAEGKENIIKQITVNNYYSPLLLLAGDVLIAVAGVNYKKEQQTKTETENCIGILTKYINDQTWENIISDSGNKWTTQFVLDNKIEQEKNKNVIKSLLGVVTDEKIYLLMINYVTPVPPEEHNSSNSELKFSVGTITKNFKETIVWDDNLLSTVDETNEFKKKLKNEKLTDYSFSGSAFFTKEEIVVFALVVQNEKKTMVALLYLKKNDTNFNLSYKEFNEKCYPYVFLWEDKIIMLLTKCKTKENNNVMEFDITNNNWNESKEQFFYLWSFLKDKHSFVTITIENERFLLFAEEKTTTDTQKEIYLWITDGSRLSRVGTIKTEYTIIFKGSLLYTKNELIALHKKIKDDVQGEEENIVSLTQLKNQQKGIAKILNIWKENKNKIEELCNNNAITQISCSTKGLVGLLSDNKEKKNSPWQDWYLNVNADVKNGEQITDGFSFNEKSAGALWPVGTSPNGLPYNFVDSGFTLLATVSINKHIENNDNSVLGVGIDDNKKTIGLWCTNDGKWKISKEQMEGDKKIEAVEGVCDQGETYQIAVTLSKETKEFLVYVNGKPLKSLTKDINMDEFKKITYFYFGVDTSKDNSQSTAESHLKVTNVLLYNRPFTSDECKDLKATKSKNVLPISQENKSGTTQYSEKDDSAAQKEETDSQKDITDSPETLNSQDKTTESISLHPKESAVNVTIIISNIFYLLLHLLVLKVGVCEFLVIP